MDELRATLEAITRALVQADVQFHVTGGLASSFYGEPRLTQDIDVVVHLAPDTAHLVRLLDALSERFLVDAASARYEIAAAGMFQALDTTTLLKVGLHVGEAIQGELQRSRHEEVLAGLRVPLVSREDAILSKLLWVQRGSAKSQRDAVMMLRRSDSLDGSYLDRQAAALGITHLLEAARGEAGRVG